MIKPGGYKFEALGLVRGGSKSTEAKNITFSAMECGAALSGKATFVMDRGYNDNKMFLKPDELGQDYVIRLTAKRKLFFHRKWVPATQLRNQRKGKIKTPIIYKSKNHDAYLSHVKVQITASKKDIYLVLVYGITEHPMMLATNKEIRTKEDVVRVAKLYFSRWRIGEYFRCKKQMFRFEGFRVRKLVSINALNFYITLCMAFLAHMSMKPETSALKVSILQEADPIKDLVLPADKGHLRHAILRKRRRQALVPDEAACIPSAPPPAGRINREKNMSSLARFQWGLFKCTCP